MSEAVLPEMTTEGAERLSTRISARLDAIADNYVGVMPLIREALSRNVYLTLGYLSHGAYVKDRFGDALGKLGMDMRREVVRELSNAGLSTRAIAPVVGVSHMTVATDIAGVKSFTPDAPASPAEPTPGAPAEAEAVAAPRMRFVEEPRAVVGLDGKAYTAPAPKPAVVVDPEQQNAEQYSIEFGRALVTLLRFENPGYGPMLRSQWDRGQDACPVGYKAVANPEGFRRIAAALTALADEWTD